MRRLLLVLFAATLLLSCGAPDPPGREHYVIKKNEQPMGWITADWTSPTSESPHWTVEITHEVHLTLLGQRVRVDTHEVGLIDSTLTTMFELNRMETNQNTKVESGWKVEGDSFSVHTSTLPGPHTGELTADMIFELGIWPGPILRHIEPVEGAKFVHRVLNSREALTGTREWTWVRTDTLSTGAGDFPCAVLDSVDPEIAVRARVWLDLNTGRMVQVRMPDGVSIVRESRAKMHTPRPVVMDDVILHETDTYIADIPKIRRMVIEAHLVSVGDALEVADLNVPGQTFEGTVDFNEIQGVFTIEQPLYFGAGAPGFPTEEIFPESMQRWLEPEAYIESSDSTLVAFARELTAGATDRWEATQNISRWVAEEIGYAIPGGGTARGTYDMGEAECGGHTRLSVALCRAVGIPARFVIGAMYFHRGPEQGAFGQHAWTEVYMGEIVGWISLDTTAREIDGIDAGHIRLGFRSLFHPKSMRILDYTVEDSGASR